MTIMRVAFVVLALAIARDAYACSCMESGPPCQSFFQVPAVFAGTVRSVTQTPRVRTVIGERSRRVRRCDRTPRR